MRVALLCGGVGGSKLALGLYKAFPEADLRIVVNTADDFTLLGLHVSPDIDTVIYTLAGIANSVTGWGIEGDTFHNLQMLHRFGQDGWFQIGDRDLATHLLRTNALAGGASLTDVTARVSRALGVAAGVLPMTDDPVRTRVRTAVGWLEFQEYFVKRRHADEPLEVEHTGVERSQMTERVREAIRTAEIVVVAPSNPVVSIGPMLKIPNLADELRRTPARKIAVSPIVGSEAFTGPAAALMEAVDCEPSVAGVAHMYAPWLDCLVIDNADRNETGRLEALGVRARATNTWMNDLDAKKRLAEYVIGVAQE